jgi:hypothetical protein
MQVHQKIGGVLASYRTEFHTGVDGARRRAWTYALERVPGLEYKKDV